LLKVSKELVKAQKNSVNKAEIMAEIFKSKGRIDVFSDQEVQNS